MKLEGSLTVYPLRELLEMILYSSVTGALHIYNSQHEGAIFFENGQPYHAAMRSLVGMDAIVISAEDPTAQFAFTDARRIETISLWGDPLELIEQFDKLALRWSHIRPTIQNVWMIPRLLITLEQVQSHLSKEYQDLCATINGRLSIEALSRALHWELLPLCEVVAQLTKRGVIALDPPTELPGVQVVRTPTNQRQKQTLLDRLMATLPDTLEPELPTHPTLPPSPTADATPAPLTPPADPQKADDPQAEAILRILRRSS